MSMNQFFRFSLGFCAMFAPFYPQIAWGYEPEIAVGIVQRFGANDNDRLVISDPSGKFLDLKLLDQDRHFAVQTLTLSITEEKLPSPELAEYLVLADHVTFETAEDDALKWQKLGIETEVTQPDRWQVWAKRSVYNTPLLRRLLLENLKQAGYADPYLETALKVEKPAVKISFGQDSYLSEDVAISSPSDRITVSANTEREQANRLYGGELKVQANAYGDYTLVNEVPLETYLRGVVPHEIGPNAPPSATEAQAIIARTYALRNLRRFDADNYQLCATTQCQVYRGLQDTTPRADNAIENTKGLVLTYQNELIDSLYSSTTGGVTAPFSDAWDGPPRPYLKAVIDSPQPLWNLNSQSLENEANLKAFLNLTEGFNESSRNVFRWSKFSSLANLSADLKTYLTKRKNALQGFNRIQRIEIVQRSPSGRALLAQVTTDVGIIELKKNEIRSAFSPPISTLFYLEPVINQGTIEGYNFIGGGYGHGVGLSQYGSYSLSRLGWSADQILNFYYPGTSLEPLREDIILWSGSN